MLKRHHQLVLMLLRFGDVVTMLAAWVLAYLARHVSYYAGISPDPPPMVRDGLPAMVMTLVLTPLVFRRFGLYEPKRTKSLFEEWGNIFRAVVVVWGLMFIIASLSRHIVLSRVLLVSMLIVWLVLASVNRLVSRGMLRALRRRGWNKRVAAIVGTGRLAQRLYHTLRKNVWTGIEPLYFVDDSERDALLGLNVLGPVESVEKIISHQPVDIVFIALPDKNHDKTKLVLNALETLPLDIRIVPDLLSFQFLGHDVTQLDNLPIISMTHSPQHGWNSLLKRGFDVVASLICLAVAAVPMIAIAVATRLTGKGPVFFRQQRASLSGKPFSMIKFRTMIPDAEKNTGAVMADRGDPRVTRLGAFLRKTSLDELPQLFNVLVGDMSLVGPRPERPELIARFRKQIPRYMLRSQVKAGLTGWAQVNGLRGGKTSLRKRVQYDVYYITNWTFGLDLRILVMTMFRGFINPNAY